MICYLIPVLFVKPKFSTNHYLFPLPEPFWSEDIGAAGEQESSKIVVIRSEQSPDEFKSGVSTLCFCFRVKL